MLDAARETGRHVPRRGPSRTDHGSVTGKVSAVPFAAPATPYKTVAKRAEATERRAGGGRNVTNMIGLVLADDHRVFAEGLGVMLDAQDDLAVLGVAHDSHQAIELAARHPGRPASLRGPRRRPDGRPPEPI